METEYIGAILVFTFAFLIAFFTTPIAKKMAIKLNAIDVPTEERRMHSKPVPRLGGLAIVFGFMMSLIIYFFLANKNIYLIDKRLIGFVLGIVIIEIAGIIDDIKPIGAWIKLLFQILAATTVVLFGVRVEFITNPFDMANPIFLGAFSIPLTIIWIVGITNAINFIDGLDGLAAGTASIASLALLFISILSNNFEIVFLAAALAGATLGFLPFNFNPAKIFMGETGSAFLGFTLGTMSIMGLIKGYTVLAIVVPVVVLGFPIFDTAFAIIRRVVHKKSPMVADRGHLHHRLVDAGLTQKQTVLILYIVSAFLGLIALVLVQSGIWKLILLLVAIVCFIIGGRKLLVDMHNIKDNGRVKDEKN